MHDGDPKDDQDMDLEKKKEKNKRAQGKGINLRAILFWTQDTIESVSHLGSIAVLLRGELFWKRRSSCASRSNHHGIALGSRALT